MSARLVSHIDDAAIAGLTDAYRDSLPGRGRIFDLTSSPIGHLPEDRHSAEVAGHEPDGEELAADPLLPLGDREFTSALHCVGAQFLQRPFEVFEPSLRPSSAVASLPASVDGRERPGDSPALTSPLRSMSGHPDGPVPSAGRAVRTGRTRKASTKA